MKTTRIPHLLPLLLLLFTGCSYLGERDAAYENKVDETADYIHIHAPDQTANEALLFYPGGLVDPNVYNSWCDKLVTVRPKLMVLIIKMPMNLAVFSPEKGLKHKKKFTQVSRWIIGGHSLGGTMAARVVHDHPNDFRALVLLGSYPAETDDLSGWTGNVLSLSAQYDGLSTPQKIDDNKKLLPTAYTMASEIDFPPATTPYTAYYQIPGANHAQFGSYGTQKGDGNAGISREQQQQTVVQSLQTFMEVLWP